jgi:hypothetical protein
MPKYRFQSFPTSFMLAAAGLFVLPSCRHQPQRRRTNAAVGPPPALPGLTGADARCQAEAITTARPQPTRAAATGPPQATKEPHVRWQTNDIAESRKARERTPTSEKVITDVTAGMVWVSLSATTVTIAREAAATITGAPSLRVAVIDDDVIIVAVVNRADRNRRGPSRTGVGVSRVPRQPPSTCVEEPWRPVSGDTPAISPAMIDLASIECRHRRRR